MDGGGGRRNGYQGSLFSAAEDGDVSVEEITLHLVIRGVLARGARCEHDVHGGLKLHQRRLFACRHDVVAIASQNLPCIVHRDQLQAQSGRISKP